MTPILTRQNYLPPQPRQEQLFSGIFLRWRALTLSEKVVCANIVLFPLWWLVGVTNYMPLFFALGIIVYEYWRYKTLYLQRPSVIVIALFAYYAYGYIDDFMISQGAYFSIEVPSDLELSPNSLIKGTFAFAIPFLIWYCQSKQIKVRLEPVLWSCSFTIIMMLLGWIVFEFALSGMSESPPRTIYATLTGKSRFNPEDVNGWSNYLVFVEKRTTESRVRFFFDHYQTAAIFLGFAVLLALDLKNRLWSGWLIAICFFLLALAAARAVWVALIPALICRYLWSAAKSKLGWLVFLIFAIGSFGIFLIPPVTQGITDTLNNTTEQVGNARAGSTEARGVVYRETIKRIPDKIIFGHKVPGKHAASSTALVTIVPRIGTHSFILGDLLYQKGIVGTTMFATFWISLIVWLYNTRIGRPMGSFLFLLMLTLTSVVSVIHLTMILCTLLCIIIYQPKPNIYQPIQIASRRHPQCLR